MAVAGAGSLLPIHECEAAVHAPSLKRSGDLLPFRNLMEPQSWPQCSPCH